MEMRQNQSISSASNMLEDYEDETVTVKFNANQDQELFTKAFDIRTTIKDIKAVLIALLRIDISAGKISVEQGERILSDDSTLASLGVAALGAIELNVKVAARCKLDKNLIYEYMPTLDIITVRVGENKTIKELVVEIEDQRCRKPWLGGYVNRITRTQYHHAVCQTRLPLDKVGYGAPNESRCTQTVCTTDCHTSTASNKSVQVSHNVFNAPSKNDLILTTKRNFQRESFFKNDVTVTTNTSDAAADMLIGQSCDIRLLQNMRREIEQRRPNLKSLAGTVGKFLSRLNECESRIVNMRRKSDTTAFAIFDKYAKPFVFNGSADQRPISIHTKLNQRAEKLKEAFTKYEDRNSTSQQKHQAIEDMRTLFKQIALENDHDKLGNEIVTLLDELTDMNKYAITSTRSLRSRIRQKIFHFFESRFQSAIMKLDDEIKYDLVSPISTRDSLNFQSTCGRMLRCLQRDEMRRFHSFSSVCFKLRTVEFAYLVGKIWRNTPIYVPSDTDRRDSSDNNSSECRITRWNKYQEWSPWNCVLLVKTQLNAHLSIHNVESSYDASTLSDVKTKHLEAKIYFNKLLSTTNSNSI